MALFLAVLVWTLWYGSGIIDFIMFPSKGAERFDIDVELDTGSSLQATSERVTDMESVIRELPEGELDTFITRVGRSRTGGIGENYAHILVGLTPFSERARNADEIIEEVRPKVESIEGVRKTTFVVDTGGLEVGKPTSLRVIGNDNEIRGNLVQEIISFLETVDGVKDIDSDDKLGKEQTEVKLNYDRLARVGLTVADVAQNVRIAYDGEVVTRMRDGDEDVDFRVQLAEKARRNVNYLYNLSIPNQQNRLIKLGSVARLDTTPGPAAYHHYDGERTTTIEADIDQDIATSLEATNMVLSNFDMKNWPGLRLEAGGEAEESAESIAGLMATFSIAFIGIYCLLVLLFDSFTQPFLVLFAVPFGIVGVILAFIWHGEHMSFMGVMRIIGLIGVVVNDSLVLVSHLNDLRKQRPNENIKQVVGEGTADRLRAIILTSLTTAAGLLPLAYGIGGTDIYMQPMALALGYGIVFATPLSLVLIPCLYTIGVDIRKIKGKIFRRKEKSAL